MPRRLALVLTVLTGLLLLALLPVLLSRLWVEHAWFAQFGFEAVLMRRWLLQISSFLLVFGVGSTLQLQQLQRCWRLRQEAAGKALPSEPMLPLRNLGLVLLLAGLLLLLAVGLSYLAGQARGLIAAPFSGRVLTGLPMLADVVSPLVLLLALLLLLPLLLWPLTTLRVALAVALAGSATALARGWSLWLPALLATPFGRVDPLTGLDLSFTVLQLPALRLLLSVVFAQGAVGLAACLWLTFSEGTSLTDLAFPGLSRQQQRVLQPQVAVLALVAALSSALAPFDLMVQGSGVAAGAGFVDLHVRLPLRLLLSALLLLCAFGLLVPLPRGWLRRAGLLPLAGSAVMVLLSEWLLAPLIQRLFVQPRELRVESPYLQRSIQATRQAFGLDRVKVRTQEPTQALSQADLEAATGTIANIRLWDSKPLLATNRQLQQLRLYYHFPSAAVDRYPLDPNPKAAHQQVLISAREMDVGALPPGSRTWLNQHLIFTHGYGFTVSTVNAFGRDGLPLYFVKDLGRSGRVQGIPELGLSTEAVQRALPVGRPQLYFSSAPAPYAIAPTRVQEFDYPDGDLNVYSHYAGRPGVPLRTRLQRFAAATYLREPRLLFTSDLTERSSLLMRRQVKSRLAALAPFLRFESQPYLVTVNLKEEAGFRKGQHQYWLLDGFTDSRSYPYSEANAAGIRYFRNPVKAVVDAYDGRVWLYVNEPDEPILRTWRRAFPELFRPLNTMPSELLQHIQVPQSQFAIQAERLLRYHVTDVRTFYNGDDVWSVPSEVYGSSNVSVQPYQVTVQLPGRSRPEFLLLLPFSPLKRSNLVGWLAARNDPPHYGELVLMRYPQQRLLLGPQQVSALIEQDPQISYQFGLWNRTGSRLFRGNLLVLPVGSSLLYVEPIYLQARSTDFPTLVRVVVSDGRTFVMEQNLQRALQRLMERTASNHSAANAAADEQAGQEPPPIP